MYTCSYYAASIVFFCCFFLNCSSYIIFWPFCTLDATFIILCKDGAVVSRSVILLLFGCHVFSLRGFTPVWKQHGAFSDFVPKCSELIIFPFKKAWTLPVDDKWIRTILNLVSKEIAWGALRLFFRLVFHLCANVNYAPLLFNNISPLSPAVSYVKIVKYVCNCRSKK